MITVIPPVFVNELSDDIKFNSNETIHVTHSDVYLLLNQKRIKSYNQTDVDKYFTIGSPSVFLAHFHEVARVNSWDFPTRAGI